MPWPTPQDYNEAIQNPGVNLGDADLKRGSAECNKLGLPAVISGGFASVYKVTVDQTPWALRCFDREVPDAGKRYGAIDAALNRAKLPYTLPFKYEPRGILVRGAWYPVVKMEWVTGDSLEAYVGKHLQDSALIKDLTERWLHMAEALHRAGIAHGDLQHGNVLVSQGDLKLVDYDGMYVPELKNEASNEIGHTNYQHPRRNSTHFSPALDHFSAWLIYLSLYGLSVKPDLWQVLNGGDECLLFRKADLIDPAASQAFLWFKTVPDPALQQLADQVRRFLTLPPLQVPPLLAPSLPVARVAASRIPATAGSSSARTGNPGITAGSTSAWYRQPQSNSPSLPPMPPPGQPPQVMGAMAWLPATQIAASPRGFGPVPSWHGVLALLCLLSLAFAATAFLLFPSASPGGILFVAIVVAVTAVRYRREPAVCEKRAVQKDVRELRGILKALSRELRRLNRERRDTVARYEAAEHALEQAKSEVQGRIRQEQHAQSGEVEKNVTMIDALLQRLAPLEQEETRQALKRAGDQHVARFLQRCSVEEASIRGVGDAMKKRLARAGVASAAQVSTARVAEVEGFGGLRTHAVLQWAQGCRAAAERTMPKTLDPADRKQIEQKYLSLRQQLESNRTEIQRNLPVELNAIEQRHTAWLEGRARDLITEAQGYVDRVPDLDRQIDDTYREHARHQLKLQKTEQALLPFKHVTMFFYVGRLYWTATLEAARKARQSTP